VSSVSTAPVEHTIEHSLWSTAYKIEHSLWSTADTIEHSLWRGCRNYGRPGKNTCTIQVSFAKEPNERDDILQKRPII